MLSENFGNLICRRAMARMSRATTVNTIRLMRFWIGPKNLAENFRESISGRALVRLFS
ncbi:hypothetical protein RSSM_04853 [Rhodopirellula sallentina SM41]|uniref:Uncharacterized protein n=1 Tax=Rhodopirellula sallentina SM41 TaxID=1263870 RepID=M5TWZ1_9BACT|nr:hypothetical protein RSSM_04853 [Rhodopirellula sallentina SM41]